ncbi:MAG: spore germination protein [Bacillota bacterium]|nr:spore germination protein [Bacillota bacterium]
MVFFTPLVINLLGFKVNSVDNSSVINAGSLFYIDQFTSYKRNQAFGEQNGDLSPINIPIMSVIDPDIADSPTVKNSLA